MMVKGQPWEDHDMNKRIASASGDGTVQVWNAYTGAIIYTYIEHTNTIDAVAWSPNSRYIASGSWDHTVRVWVAPPTK